MTIEEKRKQYDAVIEAQRERYEELYAVAVGLQRALRMSMFFLAASALCSITAVAFEVWQLISRAQ